MGNINNNEFEFLNNGKVKEKNNNFNILNILYYILYINLYAIYGIVCIFCRFIEILFGISFIKTAVKTTYNKKRKKKRLFF